MANVEELYKTNDRYGCLSKAINARVNGFKPMIAELDTDELQNEIFTWLIMDRGIPEAAALEETRKWYHEINRKNTPHGFLGGWG